MKTKYNLNDVMGGESIDANVKVVQKLNEFLTKGESFGVLYCGEKVYKYLQFSINFTHSVLNEENLELPIEFGTWSNEEKKITLYFSPDKYKEDEFTIEN